MKNCNQPNWADLVSVRNWINQLAYGEALKVSLLPHVMAGLAFLFAIRLAIYSSPTLVFQFIVGSTFLYLVKNTFNDRIPHIPVNSTRMKSFMAPMGLHPALLGVLGHSFQTHSRRSKEVPLQENTLLVLALIWIQQYGFSPQETNAQWLVTQTVFFSGFSLLRWREAVRSELHLWLGASEAMKAYVSGSLPENSSANKCERLFFSLCGE